MEHRQVTKKEALRSSKMATKSATKSGVKSHSKPKAGRKNFAGLSKELLLKIHELMVKSRVLEERLIKIYRAGESYFWIGGPGEEAWGVPLGLLAKKGQGLDHDWLHLH